MSNDNELHAQIDRIENERLEASLRKSFADLGDIGRIPSVEGPLWGWRVLGGVEIERNALPVDFSGETEEEAHVEHRQQILDIVRAAYMAGRSSAETHEDVDQDLAMATARLAALREEFDANEAKIARALRGRHA